MLISNDTYIYLGFVPLPTTVGFHKQINILEMNKPAIEPSSTGPWVFGYPLPNLYPTIPPARSGTRVWNALLGLGPRGSGRSWAPRRLVVEDLGHRLRSTQEAHRQ